jgi:hypothetical protein
MKWVRERIYVGDVDTVQTQRGWMLTATKGVSGLRCEENRKRARCNHTGGALATTCMRVHPWEVANDLHGQDARKHADYSPIARGEKSGESVARRGVACRGETQHRDAEVAVVSVNQVTVRFINLGFYVQLSSLTFSKILPVICHQLNHAERYRSRQGSWRAGTWKGCGSRRQRHSSWWPRTWRRPRSRWWIRTPRTGRVCDLCSITTPYSYLVRIFAEGRPAVIDARLSDSAEDHLVLSFKALSLRQDAMPPRPGYGTKG